MAIEILTVSLSDESIEALANAVARILRNHPPGDYRAGATTESNPPSSQPPQPAARPESPQQADPWATATPAQQWQQTTGPTYAAPAATAPAPQAGYSAAAPPASGQYQQQVPQGPTCAHGPMKYVAAGQNARGPYPAFWACDVPRGTPNKCKSVTA